MAFTEEEINYLRSQPLARVATVGDDGQPDVVPVAFEVDDDGTIWIGGSGETVLRTRKVVNVTAGRTDVALVVDDLASFNPFIARGIRIYASASGPVERVGMIGPGLFLRLQPTISWAWNLAGEPVGDEWYPAVKRMHDEPPGT